MYSSVVDRSCVDICMYKYKRCVLSEAYHNKVKMPACRGRTLFTKNTRNSQYFRDVCVEFLRAIVNCVLLCLVYLCLYIVYVNDVVESVHNTMLHTAFRRGCPQRASARAVIQTNAISCAFSISSIKSKLRGGGLFSQFASHIIRITHLSSGCGG